jgi:hypothetical protein
LNPRARLGLAIGVLLVAGALSASFLIDGGTPDGQPTPTDRARPAANDISPEDQRRRVRVEVLNGAGDAGAAALVTESLREAGFDVKTYGNADRFDHEASYVIDRSGRPGAASAVATALGGVGTVERIDPELYLDATVILGGDWRELISPRSR